MARNSWFIDSETGLLQDVLLCPPDHYEWIPTNDIAARTIAGGARVDRVKLKAQFDGLVATLEGEGVTCHFLQPQPGLRYQVYTRDSSQVTPFGVVQTSLQRPERAGEVALIRAFYGEDGFAGVCSQGHVEGGDIHIIRPGLVVVGVSGGRTDLLGAEEFLSAFAKAGWTTRIIYFPEHFLHLDVIFSMVSENLALACVDVLDDADLEWLQAQGIRLLPVSYKEAMRDMACNVLALGERRVISPAHSARVNAMLEAEGMRVIPVALDQFSRGGGSIHCMTMPLRRVSLNADSNAAP